MEKEDAKDAENEKGIKQGTKNKNKGGGEQKDKALHGNG